MFIQALNKEQPPNVALKFDNGTHEELLVVDEVDKEMSRIIDVKGSASKSSKQFDEVLTKKGLTSLDLMYVAVPYTIADVICDMSYHRTKAADDMAAFGQIGVENVQAFKNKWFAPYVGRELPTYKLEDPFVVDLENLKVTLGFECLMEGKEGRGTDYVYINEQKLITKIDVVREK